MARAPPVRGNVRWWPEGGAKDGSIPATREPASKRRVGRRRVGHTAHCATSPSAWGSGGSMRDTFLPVYETYPNAVTPVYRLQKSHAFSFFFFLGNTRRYFACSRIASYGRARSARQVCFAFSALMVSRATRLCTHTPVK